MQGIIPTIAIVLAIAFYGLLFQAPQPYVTISANREVSFTVPERSGTQYIYAYIKNGNADRLIYCYFNPVPNYNGKCSRAHEPQFQYFVEYRNSVGNVIETIGPLQVILQPTAFVPTITLTPTKTPIPTATPRKIVLPIIIK